jgi:hypothetical protein
VNKKIIKKPAAAAIKLSIFFLKNERRIITPGITKRNPS